MLRKMAMAATGICLVSALAGAQEQAPNRREFTLTAREHVFTPNRFEVSQDDLVKITLTSEGRPSSFAIDAYRIAKRAGGGQTITFEFRADQAGTFTFYCNLTGDEGCKDMKGTLVVKPR
ncbi:MAG: cupredoxin domain-containing protein [Vicinamibacterales bacterium]